MLWPVPWATNDLCDPSGITSHSTRPLAALAWLASRAAGQFDRSTEAEHDFGSLFILSHHGPPVTELWQVLALTMAAGAMIPAGGLLAHFEHLRRGDLRDDLLAGVVAFGGGALLAAVVLVLVPDALEHAGPLLLISAFLAGALVALWGSYAVRRMGTKAGQFMAMLFDFVPESLALGAVAATGGPGAVLLAILIGLQNLPEGFNAYRDMCNSDRAKWGHGPGLWLLAGAALLGPAAGWVGYQFIVGEGPVLAAIVMAASGAILALVFHDIAPLAHRDRHPAPTMGMVFGFALGLVGSLVL